MSHDLGVKCVARDTHSSVAQQIRIHTAMLTDGRADADQREVARLAHEFSNQNQFVVNKRSFLFVIARDWLQSESDGVEAGQTEVISKSILGIVVVLERVRAVEANRAADGCVADVYAELPGGAIAN